MLRVLEYSKDIRSILKKVYALIMIVMIQLGHICPNVTSADKTIVVACYNLWLDLVIFIMLQPLVKSHTLL